MLTSPFAWCFQTPGGHYVYDVNTSGFFRVSPAVHDVIAVETRKAKGAAVTPPLVERHGAIAIEQAREQIREQQAQGVFLPDRPKALRFSLDRQEIEERLRSRVQLLTLCLTEVCNLRCQYCAYGGGFTDHRGHSTRQMDWDTARKAIDLFLPRAAANSEASLTFYGGEPLANLPLLDKAAAYARSRRTAGLGMQLTTNGTLLTARAVATLVRHDIGILVSLDGPADIHDAARTDTEGRGSFDRVMRNVAALHATEPDYFSSRVAFIVSYRRVADLPRIRAFFASQPELFGGARLLVNAVQRPDDQPPTEDTDPAQQAAVWRALTGDYVEAVTTGRRTDAFLTALYFINLARIHRRPQVPMPDTLHPNGICVPGVQRLFCTVDGRLLVCERVAGSFEIGDLERGVDADAALRLVEGYAASSVASGCLDCPAIRLCTACFTHATAHGMDGPAEVATPHRRCDAIRANLEHMMSVYCAIGEARPDALRVFGGAGA